MLAGKHVFMYSPAFEQYAYPPDCPFTTQRAGEVRRTLLSMGLLSGSDRQEVEPTPVARPVLERFHQPAYLEALIRASRCELSVDALHMGIGTPDCPVFDGMFDYASLAVGASVDAARMLIDGEAVAVFNPSGGYHHAFPDRAAGFCFLNDVVLACLALTDAGKRVLFLDVDVHHCDGVQAAFYERSDVLTISLHETGASLFPGTGFENEIGHGEGAGYSVNVPLPEGTHDDAYLRAFDSIVPPLARAYAPDVIVAEFGADALAGDPLAHLELTNNVYADIAARLLALDRPILATGGGGYHVENTVRAWSLLWAVLCGDDRHDDMMLGIGGVMLESTDWLGGLRDRVLAPHGELCAAVDDAVDSTVEKLRTSVFPVHGL